MIKFNITILSTLLISKIGHGTDYDCEGKDEKWTQLYRKTNSQVDYLKLYNHQVDIIRNYTKF